MNIRRILQRPHTPTYLLLIGGLLGFLSCVFFIIPSVLSMQLPKVIQQQTGYIASSKQISIALFPLTAQLRDFSLYDPTQQNVIKFERLFVKINFFASLRHSQLVLDTLVLNRATLQLSQDNGRLTLLPTMSTHASETPLPKLNALFPVTIEHLIVKDAELRITSTEHPPTLTHSITGLTINLENFSTRPLQPASFTIALLMDNVTKLTWHGNLNLSSLSSEGVLTVSKLALANLSQTLAAKITADISLTSHYQISVNKGKLEGSVDKGVLNVEKLHYENAAKQQVLSLAHFTHHFAGNFNYSPETWQINFLNTLVSAADLSLRSPAWRATTKDITLRVNYQLSQQQHTPLNVNITQAQLKTTQLSVTADKQSVLNVAELQFDKFALQVQKHTLNLGNITARQPQLNLLVNTKGELNLNRIFATQKPTPILSPQTNPIPDWNIKIATLGITEGTLHFKDQHTKHPVQLNISPINATLNSMDLAQKHALSLTATINNKAVLTIAGEGVLNPLVMRLNMALQQLELNNFQGYFDSFIHTDHINGTWFADGLVTLAELPNWHATFKGNSQLKQFSLYAAKEHSALLTWQRLALVNLATEWPSLTTHVEQLSLIKPYVRFIIDQDRRVNFANLVLKNNEAHLLETVTKSPQQARSSVKIDTIAIQDGRSDFSDYSLFLPFTAQIHALEGGAKGLSNAAGAHFDIALKGNAYDLAPVDIQGELTPDEEKYHFSIHFQDLPMPLVSPYMVQFAGYKVENGNLDLALDYTLAHRKLTANNNLLIEHFELGDKIDHPNAVALPIKLAVALLKDANGRIKFDIPITGSLDNPHFSVSHLIIDAVSNALLKIISSPFQALTGLFTTEEALKSLTFAPGSAQLTSLHTEQLNALAKGLRQHEKLSLYIKGISQQDYDWPALRINALTEYLKQHQRTETNSALHSDDEHLSTKAYQRLLAEVFIEKFPLLAELSWRGKPSLKNPQQGDFYALAEQKLLTIFVPEPQRLKELAAQRAQAIVEYLLKNQQLSSTRLHLLNPEVNTSSHPAEHNAELLLRAD